MPPKSRRSTLGSLQRMGAKPSLELLEVPDWHAWQYRSTAARAQRWIAAHVPIPTGHGAGRRMRLAGFQQQILRATYRNLVTFALTGTGNGKTTFLAAVGLERICRGDELAEVDVVATSQDQASVIVNIARRMVELNPDLTGLFAWYSHDQVLEYRPTASVMAAYPARLKTLEGLNFALGLVEEVGFVADDFIESLISRLAKRPDAAVLGMGTPGLDPNIVFDLGKRAEAGTLPQGVELLHWQAPAHCDIGDRAAWRAANPALSAGFMRAEALEVQAGVVSEARFRVRQLAQWLESAATWLPGGAWEACPYVAPPPDGSEVVVGVEGTYLRGVAVVGCGLDGSLFMVWAAEAATDSELDKVLGVVCERWRVRAIVHGRRIRARLFARLAGEGFPVEAWPGAEVERTSADEFYRAIVDRLVAHDHDLVLSQHVTGLAVQMASDRSIRLVRPDGGQPVDAGLAARSAWWRASQLAVEPELEAPAVF